VFKIVKVQRTNPVTYLFEDYRGKIYSWSVLRVRVASRDLSGYISRGKSIAQEIYVKWLGFDGSHNSWIHKN